MHSAPSKDVTRRRQFRARSDMRETAVILSQRALQKDTEEARTPPYTFRKPTLRNYLKRRLGPLVSFSTGPHGSATALGSDFKPSIRINFGDEFEIILLNHLGATRKLSFRLFESVAEVFNITFWTKLFSLCKLLIYSETKRILSQWKRYFRPGNANISGALQLQAVSQN